MSVNLCAPHMAWKPKGQKVAISNQRLNKQVRASLKERRNNGTAGRGDFHAVQIEVIPI